MVKSLINYRSHLQGDKLKNQMLQPSDAYDVIKSLDPPEADLSEYLLVILHYKSGEQQLKWTSRIRDIQKQKSKTRILENFIAIYMKISQIGRLLLNVENQSQTVLLNGYRYFGPEKGWVDYVEEIDIENLTCIEYHDTVPR